MSLRQRFDSGMAATRDDLRRMATLVLASLAIAEQVVLAPDTEARARVREPERTIDGLEMTIENRCHELMLLEAPLASDLRLLISAMRISTDLELLGDLAEGVAKRFSSVALTHVVEVPAELVTLSRMPARMLTAAMTAFESGDLAPVEEVVADEKRSDTLAKSAAAAIQVAMALRSNEVREYTQVLRAVYHFEQAADLCVCIGEEAVFFHSGRLLRHQPGTGRFERS